MKFAAAATTPGLANSSQNGTEPSAKSTQTGFLAGSEQALPFAAAGAAGRAEAVRPATAKRRRSHAFFTRGTLSSRNSRRSQGRRPATPPRLYFWIRKSALVERRIDFGDLLGLRLLARRVLLAEVRRPAEVEAQAREARAVAPVAADLLERREQRLALVGLGRDLLRRADLDRPVALEPGCGRDQLADDDVLLQPEQPVDLALDRGVGEHLRRLLERSRGEERLGREGRLRDPEDQRLEGRLLLLLLLHARVLAVKHDLVDELAGEKLGVAGVLDAHLLEHLPHDQLDVLVVDVDALGLVDLLHLLDEVHLGRRPAAQLEQLVRVQRALVELRARLDLLALDHVQARVARERVAVLLAGVVGDDDGARLVGVLDRHHAADLGD